MHDIPEIEHHDRVTDVYFRKAFSKAAQDKLIQRIDWICDVAEGSSILDIGCSQGIVEYLLAQRGKSVVGVDIDSKAINDAKTLLAELPIHEASNIRLICDDLYNLDVSSIGKFDTVLLTEVIEHLDDPRLFVLKALEFCKDNSLMVVTTPFGLHRAPDHKFTFYNSRLESCFKGVGEIISLDVVNKYYRLKIRVDKSTKFKITNDHNVIQENIVESIENNMQDSLDDIKAKLINSRESINKLKDSISRSREKEEVTKDSLSRYKQQNEKLKYEVKMLGSELEYSRKQSLEIIDTKYQELLAELQKREVFQKERQDSIDSKLDDLHLTGSANKNDEIFDELSHQMSNLSQSFENKSNEFYNKLESLYECVCAENKKLRLENEELTINKEKLLNELSEIRTSIALDRNRNAVIGNEYENKLLKLSFKYNQIVSEKSKSVKRFNALRDSFSYKFGRKVVDAFARPGIHTLILPLSIIKDLYGTIVKGNNSKHIAIDQKDSNSADIEPEFDSAPKTYSKIRPSANLKQQVYQKVLNEGLELPSKVSSPVYKPSDSVFYLCHMSMPLMTNGYATRTHHLIKAMQGSGINVRAYTRLGYPLDLNQLREKVNYSKISFDLDNSHKVDNVEYNMLKLDDLRMDNLSSVEYLFAYADAIVKQALIHKPKVLHAASDYRNGIAALIAGNKLGIPVYYEMRGLWHITKSSKNNKYADSLEFKFLSYMEEVAVAGSHKIFTLTPALESFYVNKGYDKAKFRPLPNGVELSQFDKCKVNKSKSLIEKHDLEDKVVLGYIGSVLEYEGLGLLLDSLLILVNSGVVKFKMLIVGDGEYLEELIEYSQKLKLDKYIVFTGRVTHDLVKEYYSVIDITPFPRLPLEVCELVSPIKPMEAMACRSAVIVSSVNALKEMVVAGETGLVFKKGCSSDLAVKLKTLITDKELSFQLTNNAFEWVSKNRSWTTIVNAVITDF